VKLRTKLVSASIAIPVAMATPALAADHSTPDPVTTETASPDPTTSETPAPDPTASTTPSPDPVTSETPAPDPTTSTGVPDPQYTTPTDPAAYEVASPTEVAPTQTPISPTSTYVEKRSKSAKRTSRAGFTMRVTGTRFSSLTAVKRLKRWAKKGRAGYRNGCLRLADDAYRPHRGRVSTALSQWYRAKRYGYGHTNRFAPVGAQLFWRTSNPAGHVATYIGRGKVVTNVGSGRVKVRKWKTLDRWGPYLGWAEPFYG
jgi:hypothetical protein